MMKKINFRKLVMGSILALLCFTTLNCATMSSVVSVEGTWRRDNFNNTLTITSDTIQSSSQSYTWKIISVSGDNYSIQTGGTKGTITLKNVGGNLEISGDSGTGQDNWNGTWKRQQDLKYADEFDFEVTITGDSVVITGYIGNKSDVRIPPQIQNRPVTSIGDNAFERGESMIYRGPQLTSVIIPDGVTSIGEGAFANNQLTSVSIPNSVTSIGDFAFADNKLTDVTLSDGVTSIGEGAFRGNVLSSITIPDSVTSIGALAFIDNQLTSVTIPSRVTSIMDYTFARNKLIDVTLPDSLTSIGREAFRENALSSITIPDGVTSIGHSAFANNRFTSVTIPDSVTSIGNQAFGTARINSPERRQRQIEEAQRQAQQNRAEETQRRQAEERKNREQIQNMVRFDGAYIESSGRSGLPAIRFVDNANEASIRVWVISYNTRAGYDISLNYSTIKDSNLTIIGQSFESNVIKVSSDKNNMRYESNTSTLTYVFRPFSPITGIYSRVRGNGDREYSFLRSRYVVTDRNGIVHDNDPLGPRTYDYSNGEIELRIDGKTHTLLTEIGPFIINGFGGIWKKD